jgi:D-alanyl-D-alanine carboxypeptidase
MKTIFSLLFIFIFLKPYHSFSQSLNPSINELIGNINPSKNTHFVSLDSLNIPTNKKNMYIRKEVVNPLLALYKDFKAYFKDVPFVVVSATRSYSYQEGIWQRKWENLQKLYHNPSKIAQEILKYSSMPGTSRHHWGSDFDIITVSSSYFKTAKGIKVYRWLKENMAHYGFCQPFNEGRNRGYFKEEWHWSYKPLSSLLLSSYQDILIKNPSSILQKLKFKGSKKINLYSLVKEYVLSINKDCY